MAHGIADKRGTTLLGTIAAKEQFITTAVDRTLTSLECQNALVLVTGADKTITLPSAASAGAGARVKVVTGLASVNTGLSLSPAAGDKIIGNGFTSADGKDAINTQATEVVGDHFEVTSNGTDWYATSVKGTWAREA